MRKVDDPVFMEISWSRIISFVDEAAAALVRTAFSPIIREAEDYAVVLFDGNGNSLAQSTTSAPSFIGTLPKTIRHFQAAMKDEGWHPGDVVDYQRSVDWQRTPARISAWSRRYSAVRGGSSHSAALLRTRLIWAAGGRRRTARFTRKACSCRSASSCGAVNPIRMSSTSFAQTCAFPISHRRHSCHDGFMRRRFRTG
jgi:hypothetical protein